jgi:threonine/homoserine/homoserine lactone efflux protein
MPPLETLLAMSAFALAASASPGPINVIGAMTGARYGAARALAFVTGATTTFLVLFLALGMGTLVGTGWILMLARPMTLIGGVYLMWLAWSLARDDGMVERDDLDHAPGFWSGALVQGLNPKAWLVVFSSLSAFVLPLADRVIGLIVFAALFGTIGWLSLALWAWGGERIGRSQTRLFSRLMALVLALSVAWMLSTTFL